MDNMQTSHRKAWVGTEPTTFLLWGDCANHCTIVPPHYHNVVFLNNVPVVYSIQTDF